MGRLKRISQIIYKDLRFANIPSHHHSRGASSEWYAEKKKSVEFSFCNERRNCEDWIMWWYEAKHLNSFTSSGIFSRVLINWTRVRIILQAELLKNISRTNSISLISERCHDKIISGLNYILFCENNFICWGVISVVELHLKVPPCFLFPVRLIFMETSCLSESE